MSGWGSVCERGVEGLREDMLSSDVLLSWRASVWLSPMAAASAAAGWLELEGDASSIADFVAGGALFGLLSGIGPVWGLAVGMDLTRWSWCRSSFTFSGGERFEAVMAAVCEYT